MLGLSSKFVLSQQRLLLCKGEKVIHRRLSNDPTNKTRALLAALKLGKSDNNDAGAWKGKVRSTGRRLRDRNNNNNNNKGVSGSEASGISAITEFLQPATKPRSDGNKEEKEADTKSPKSFLWQDLLPPRQEPTDNHSVSKDTSPYHSSSRRTSAIESFLLSTTTHQPSSNTAVTGEPPPPPPRKWWSRNLTPQHEPTDKKKSIFDVFSSLE